VNSSTKWLAGVAVIVVVAAAATLVLPRLGLGQGGASATPSASSALLARGTFKAKGTDIELDATGGSASTAGHMTISDGEGGFNVDLRCSLTADDGRILIGGDTTASTVPWTTKGGRTAIVLKPGSPVHVVFDFEHTPRAADCPAYLDGIVDRAMAKVIGPDGLEPIEGGSIQFGS
jgi:hypothetical protein